MSWQMKLVRVYTRARRRPRYASEAASEAFLAAPKGSSAPPRWLSRRHQVEKSTIGGFDVYAVRTTAYPARSSGDVVYVHGGGYVSQIASAHWRFIDDVADATGATVLVPLYGLAPDHDAEEAAVFMQAVLQRASAHGPAYLMGDPSGGGLATAATLNWIATGGLPPRGLTLLAPWLDVALTNPGIDAIEPRDPWLARAGCRVCGLRWAADLPTTDPRVSPIYGDLVVLPPIDLYIGSDDILLPDCATLRDALPAGRVTFHEEPGAPHVYPLLPVPEGRAARKTLLRNVAAIMAPTT